MRAREFLLESKILNEVMMNPKQWDKEKYALNFLEGLENQQPYSFEFPEGNKFTGIVQNPQAVMRQVRQAMKIGFASAKIRVTVAVIDEDTQEPTGQVIEDVPLSRMFKDEKIKGELKPNMGNVSEAILGCAVTAKFVKNGGLVTEQDLVNIGKQLVKNNGYLETSAGKDQLIFKVTIPFLDKKVFKAWLGEDSRGMTLKDYSVPDEVISTIDQRVRSAIEYANKSKRVLTAVEEAKSDPRNNKVDVLSDGGEKENQSTTKVDLKILIDGKETAKRLLSVKAGRVAQFGQVTGVNFEHASQFFGSIGVSLPPTLQKFFYNIAPGSRGVEDQKEHNFDNGVYKCYEFAFKNLTAQAKTDRETLVKNVFKGLKYHLTRDEPGVEMVLLDPDGKTAFRELSFGPEFEQALNQLQLVVTQGYGKTFSISIYGFPIGSIAKKYVPSRKDADSKLLDLISSFKDGSIRNMFAMGNLLKNIADIENHIEKIEQQPQAAQPAPQAKKIPPQPQAKTPAQAPASPRPSINNLKKPTEVGKIKMGEIPR